MAQKNKTKSKKTFLNKKASFDYSLLDKIEAGIALNGLEIKAIRAGKINLRGSHVKILNGEAFWIGGMLNFDGEGDQQRTRKLLLHKSEIEKLFAKSKTEGLTIIPTKVYIKKGKAKIEISLARGKKKWDKREDIKNRDQKRDLLFNLKSKK